MRHLERTKFASERMKRNTLRKTHGLSKTPEHIAWCAMKGRCHNKNNKRYPEWGGRGITVCEKWRYDFLEFLKAVGQRPDRYHSIDRIDGKKGYEPGNVRWATKEEQSSNRPDFVRKINYLGTLYNLSSLARFVGINRELLKYRLDNNWTLEKAITVPSQK